MNTQEHETYSLRFVDEQKYKPFLLEIATEVERLLVNKANRKCCERYSRWFHKKWTAYKEALEQCQQKIACYREKSSKVTRLRVKELGPPPKFTFWYDDSPLRRGKPGFWMPPCEKLLPDPILRLVSAPGGMPPQNDKEELEKYYVLLIIIHDWMLKSCVPIDNDICPEPLAKLVWVIDLNLYEEGQSIIEIAFEHVKADLAAGIPMDEKPTKAGREHEPKESTMPPPIDLTKGTWNECKNLDRLRKIDSNGKRKGIPGTKKLLREMIKYLEKPRHERSDIAKTLTHTNDGRITTSMSYEAMFLKK